MVNALAISAFDCLREIGTDNAGTSVIALSTWCESCTTYLAANYLILCHGIGSIGTCASPETLLLKISLTNSLAQASSILSTLSLEPLAIFT